MVTQTKRKRILRPSNDATNWRVYTFILNELEKDVANRGFKSVPNQVNILLAAYFNDEILQRPNVAIDSIDLTSMGTTQTNWRIRTKVVVNLRQDTKVIGSNMSALANNILLRYVLGQKVQRG